MQNVSSEIECVLFIKLVAVYQLSIFNWKHYNLLIWKLATTHIPFSEHYNSWLSTIQASAGYGVPILKMGGTEHNQKMKKECQDMGSNI